jgi:hypothetical protein
MLGAYRKTTLLHQYKNCQSWGHTKSYCHKEPRCIKCAGKHTTVTCTKPKETPPKCYNWENHSGNYWGCVIAKELQALRNKATNPRKFLSQKGQPVALTGNETLSTQLWTGVAQMYASLVKAHTPQPQEQPITDTTKKDTVSPLHTADMTINQHLQLILTKLDKQEKVHKTLFSRLDKLEKATFLRGSQRDTMASNLRIMTCSSNGLLQHK